MADQYTIESESGIVKITMLEKANLQSLISAYKDVNAVPSGRLRLWQFEQSLEMSSSDIQALASQAELNLDPGIKTAIVAHDELEYGLSRMFGVYRDRAEGTFKIFYEEASAIAWLQAESPN